MRRPGILSEVDTITPEDVEKDIAKDAGLYPAKWMGLPATVMGLPTKYIVGAVILAVAAPHISKLVGF